MNPRLLLVVAVLPLFAACTKKASDKGAAPAANEAPRRNMSESLGMASESSEGYMQNKPPSAPAAPAPTPAAASAPAPAPAPEPTSAKPNGSVRRKLTSKDGRTVEADLLAASADTVRIRRLADATEFNVPFDKLSEDDQSFIRGSGLPPLPPR